MSSQAQPAEALISQLQSVLPYLHANPYPDVPNPPKVNRRASVAVILRVNPHHQHWPSPSSQLPDPTSHTTEERIASFFAQDWVQHGDVEVLYIKRAARVGDRWTAQVAFPGGRRDAEDASDLACAIRETEEEVGLDLSNPNNAIAVGNLPQRIVSMDWGRTALMVLCPYVFLVTNHSIPPLRLQASEVGSTHWVSLRALRDPQNMATEYQDRYLSRYESSLARFLLWHSIGRMQFPATTLLPSESRYSRWEPSDSPGNAARRAPILLWGLTQGVAADLLEFVPPFDTTHLWAFPTFSPWDVRFAIWILTARFRTRLQETFRNVRLHRPADEGEGVVVSGAEDKDVGASGVLVASPDGVAATDITSVSLVSRADISNPLLGEYYSLVRKAVFLTLLGRVGLLTGAGLWAWRNWRGRR